MYFTTKDLEPEYNNSSAFKIALFALNAAAGSLYLVLMEYVSYYVNGIVGFAVVFTSVLLTCLRVFDGLIDPLVGFFIDRTHGRFGKFRPFMLSGNIMMAVSVLLMYNATHRIPSILRFPFFVLVYVIYVFGFTFQLIVAKSGQTVMTDNPKMRPLTTYFDSLFTTSSYGGLSLYTSVYLIPKYGSFKNPALFREYSITVAAISAICTILAIIGISDKDRPEYYGGIEPSKDKVKISDYKDVIFT